jgi:hypothetical protein
MSDLSQYPDANVVSVQLLFSKFRTTETRKKISEFLSKSLTENDRIKQLTRADIMEYGKSKGIIDEAAAEAGGEGVLTLNQMIGQAASDRLFEMTVAFRKAKKDKIERLKAEAAEKASADPNA